MNLSQIVLTRATDHPFLLFIYYLCSAGLMKLLVILHLTISKPCPFHRRQDNHVHYPASASYACSLSHTKVQWTCVGDLMGRSGLVSLRLLTSNYSTSGDRDSSLKSLGGDSQTRIVMHLESWVMMPRSAACHRT